MCFTPRPTTIVTSLRVCSEPPALVIALVCIMCLLPSATGGRLSHIITRRRTRRLGHVRENWDYLSENGQEGSNAGRCRSPQVDIMLLIGQPLKRYRQMSGSLRVAHGDAFCPPGGEQPTVSRCGNELDIVRRDCCGAVGGVVAAQSVKH